ncbi:MAG: hypothetical protein WBX11_00945 [Thiobacillaceae bacterium]
MNVSSDGLPVASVVSPLANQLNNASAKVSWTPYSACVAGEAWDGREQDEDQVLDAWQYLIDIGIVWTLQGWYGSTAAMLIERGLCSEKGE